ncbi:MAG: C-type lectin domain-containing protein [Kofleriaceae bacterium]|nr:C-type lectin domain-containing protein [Kofleriaceae bacterium]
MIFLLVVAMALAGAGCDNLFGLQHIPPGTPPIDSQLGDARPHDGSIDAVDANGRDAIVDSGCPMGYVQNGATAYRFVNTPTSWTAAEADCVDDSSAAIMKHTHLAVVGNDQELSLLYFTIAGSAGDLWIGLSDRVMQERFVWVTAEPVTYPPAAGSPWGAMQPSKLVGDDCVVERAGTTELAVIPCTTQVRYVCECDLFSDVPGNY